MVVEAPPPPAPQASTFKQVTPAGTVKDPEDENCALEILKLVVLPELMALPQTEGEVPADKLVTVTFVIPALLIALVLKVPVPAVVTVKVAVLPVAELAPLKL